MNGNTQHRGTEGTEGTEEGKKVNLPWWAYELLRAAGGALYVIAFALAALVLQWDIPAWALGLAFLLGHSYMDLRIDIPSPAVGEGREKGA